MAFVERVRYCFIIVQFGLEQHSLTQNHVIDVCSHCNFPFCSWDHTLRTVGRLFVSSYPCKDLYSLIYFMAKQCFLLQLINSSQVEKGTSFSSSMMRTFQRGLLSSRLNLITSLL